MKTITITQTAIKPQLEITHDEYAESPRTWTNLGYFFTKESKYKSPDGNEHELYHAMLTAEDEATDTDSHMEAIKRIAKEEYSIDILHIVPVNKYEHGRVKYARGTAHGFDHSNCGFYIVTKQSADEMGVDQTDIDGMNIYIDGELETYTKWVNGEVYQFTLYDENGEHEDSCGGFYDIDDIKEHLPPQWKDEDMEEYFIQ